MDSYEELLNITDNPKGIIARQKGIAVPAHIALYADLLLFLEKQKFPNLLANDSWLTNRREIDLLRLIDIDEYQKCLNDSKIYDAELERQKAREFIADAIFNSELKSYRYQFHESDKNFGSWTLIEKDFWGSPSAFRIDGISHFHRKTKSKIIVEAIT